MESRWQLWGGVGGVEGSSKEENGLMDTDNNVVTVEREGFWWGLKGYKGINGNRKNTIKEKKKTTTLETYSEPNNEESTVE